MSTGRRVIFIICHLLTSLDVLQSLCLAIHPDALPVACSLQVEGGDERQSDGGQVLLHTAAGHPDQRGQRVLADGVIDAVCQHVTWRREAGSVHPSVRAVHICSAPSQRPTSDVDESLRVRVWHNGLQFNPAHTNHLISCSGRKQNHDVGRPTFTPRGRSRRV